MKRVISVILDIVLVLAAVFILAGMSVKDIFAEIATDALVKKAVDSTIGDGVRAMFPDVTEAQIEDAADKISQDENLRALVGDYMDALADAAADGTPFSSPDVSSYMGKAVDDNIDAVAEAFGVELGGLPRAVLKSAAESAGSELETELGVSADEALSHMTGQQKQAAKLYAVMTSEEARTAAIAIACISAFGIVLLRLSKGRFLFHLGLCGIVAGSAAGYAFPALLTAAADGLGREMAGSGVPVSADTLAGCGKMMLAGGAALSVLYGILKLSGIGEKKRYR